MCDPVNTGDPAGKIQRVERVPPLDYNILPTGSTYHLLLASDRAAKTETVCAGKSCSEKNKKYSFRVSISGPCACKAHALPTEPKKHRLDSRSRKKHEPSRLVRMILDHTCCTATAKHDMIGKLSLLELAFMYVW